MRTAILAVVLLPHTLLAQTTQPAERETALGDVVQLTSGFARAGEAYFSPDMKWIVFQASVERDAHYQMDVAEVRWQGDAIVGIGRKAQAVQVSPANSRNTCGFFSPDSKRLIFASTVGKEKADEPTGGYKREGRSYSWSFPTGMEIYAADWPQPLPDSRVMRLNIKPLTDNGVYDAECAFSPDGKWICFTRGAGKDADIYVTRGWIERGESGGGGRLRRRAILLAGREAARVPLRPQGQRPATDLRR